MARLDHVACVQIKLVHLLVGSSRQQNVLFRRVRVQRGAVEHVIVADRPYHLHACMRLSDAWRELTIWTAMEVGGRVCSR